MTRLQSQSEVRRRARRRILRFHDIKSIHPFGRWRTMVCKLSRVVNRVRIRAKQIGVQRNNDLGCVQIQMNITLASPDGIERLPDLARVNRFIFDQSSLRKLRLDVRQGSPQRRAIRRLKQNRQTFARRTLVCCQLLSNMLRKGSPCHLSVHRFVFIVRDGLITRIASIQWESDAILIIQ